MSQATAGTTPPPADGRARAGQASAAITLYDRGLAVRRRAQGRAMRTKTSRFGLTDASDPRHAGDNDQAG
jgi:hypothetical protein